MVSYLLNVTIEELERLIHFFKSDQYLVQISLSSSTSSDGNSEKLLIKLEVLNFMRYQR